MSWRDYQSAPSPGAAICRADELPDAPGTLCRQVDGAHGAFPLLLVHDEGGLRAYVNACPHQYLPLDYRAARVMSADGRRLICSAHGAVFDARSGAPCAGNSDGSTLAEGLAPVPVVIRDGMVVIDG